MVCPSSFYFIFHATDLLRKIILIIIKRWLYDVHLPSINDISVFLFIICPLKHTSMKWVFDIKCWFDNSYFYRNRIFFTVYRSFQNFSHAFFNSKKLYTLDIPLLRIKNLLVYRIISTLNEYFSSAHYHFQERKVLKNS